MNNNQLNEGLRRGDLKHTISSTFMVDQFQSKMGEDEDVIVLSFTAVDREPAIDLMEFVEKGYSFVLDSDMSTGEESDGTYRVFIEIQRDNLAPSHVNTLVTTLTDLCDVPDWNFRWYKDKESHPFTKENFAQFVPLSSIDYHERIRGSLTDEVKEFFNHSLVDTIRIDEDNAIVFQKMYAEPLVAKLIAYGDYNTLKHALHGGIQLDESSRSESLYLSKYLNTHDVFKVENHFLIRNGDKAVILSKDKW